MQSAVLLRQSRLSVCPWRWGRLSWSHRLEIFKKSRLVSLGCSLSGYPNTRDAIQREHLKILTQSDPPPVKLSVADIWWQIVVEQSEIAQWLQWRVYRKPPSLFQMVRSPTTPTSPSPKNWGPKCTPRDIEFRKAISPQRVIRSTFYSVCGFRDWRIEWRYFRPEQIQDGGRLLSWNIWMAISPQLVIRSTSCLVPGHGFHRR